MKKLFISVITLMFTITPYIVNAKEIELAKNAKSAILLEASTGEIIYERDADIKLAPASMTKMMSMLLIVEAIEKGVINWDDKVTVSKNASSMGGSQILLETGEEMSVEDLFKGIAIASGNDAVVALAEKIAGSEDVFVDLMNKRAEELGLTNTHFVNPHGLDDNNHFSTAKDMALIAKELVKHPKVLVYTSIYETYLRENTNKKIWLVNTNKLIRFYKGADGLKTGYTSKAGYCLTATADKNNMRLIAVVMGEESSDIRNSEVTSMLDYGYAQYKLSTLLTKNSILGKIKVNNGTLKEVEVVPSEEISFLNKKMSDDIKTSYKTELYNNSKAPLKIGDKVGIIHIYQNEELLKDVDITVRKDVPKISLVGLFIRNIKETLVNVF